jgi:aminopeptidase N
MPSASLGPGLPSAPPAQEPAAGPPGALPPAGEYALGWDVLHYDIEVALPAGPGWIAGRTFLRVLRTAAEATVLPLDLVGLAATSVRVNGGPVAIDQRAGKLLVPTVGGRAGDTLGIEVVYAGTPDDGLVLGKTTAGDPSAFADNWPDRARYWFPAVDHPADKATVAFTVHAPATWEVVSNGVMVGAPTPTPPGMGGPPGERRTWRWREDAPIPTYTMVIGATELVVDTVGTAACGKAPRSPRPDGCVAVTTWLYPSDREKGAPSFRRAARMVDLLSDWVAPFPYEKLAHVQSSTRFGGMENVSAIFYDEISVAAGRDRGGRDFEETVAHETAHQWFGDSVTEADWHHLWLSEGFANYFEALFYELAGEPEVFRDDLDRPVIDPAASDLFALLNENNYDKGAWVLHMLRGVVGDSAFHAGIRAYYDRHQNGTALTSDLEAAMERASGRDLGWFFEQWLQRPGYPTLRVTHRFEAAEQQIVVDIEQTQKASWPRFRVPTHVLVRGPWGERRQPVQLDGARTTVRVPAPSAASAVIVDPDGWVLAVTEGADGAR